MRGKTKPCFRRQSTKNAANGGTYPISPFCLLFSHFVALSVPPPVPRTDPKPQPALPPFESPEALPASDCNITQHNTVHHAAYAERSAHCIVPIALVRSFRPAIERASGIDSRGMMRYGGSNNLLGALSMC